MKLMLKNVRLAFPVLWEAKTFNGEGKPAYSAALIIARDDEQIGKVKKCISAVAKERWKDKAEQVLKSLVAQEKIALRDGDNKPDYDGFSGHMYVGTRSVVRPLVIDADKTPLTESDGKPYAGCYVNASLEFWAQDNNYGKRINASLRGVQFVRDGEAFAGSSSASADEFDALVAESMENAEYADFV